MDPEHSITAPDLSFFRRKFAPSIGGVINVARNSPPKSKKYYLILIISGVADPGCLSRILIFTHPGSQILR
jgi:hypothetical protein